MKWSSSNFGIYYIKNKYSFYKKNNGPKKLVVKCKFSKTKNLIKPSRISLFWKRITAMTFQQTT